VILFLSVLDVVGELIQTVVVEQIFFSVESLS